MLRRIVGWTENLSLRTKLLALVIPLVVVPLLVVDVLVLRLMRQSNLEHAEQQLREAYEVFQMHLLYQSRRQVDLARRLAEDPELRARLESWEGGEEAPDLVAWLDERAERLEAEQAMLRAEEACADRLELHALQPPWRLLARAPRSLPAPAHAPHLPSASSVSSCLSAREGLMLTTSIRVASTTGPPLALSVGLSLPPESLRRLALRTDTFLAVMHESRVLLSGSDRIHPASWPAEELARVLAQSRASGKKHDPSEGLVREDDHAYKLAAFPLPLWWNPPGDSGSSPGLLLVGVDTGRFAAPLRQLQHGVFWVTVSAMLVTLLLAGAVVGRGILAPIQELLRFTRRVAEGNLEHRIPVRGADEIGQLARSFNVMTSRLQQFYGTLEQLVHERTSALRQSLSEAEESRRLLMQTSAQNRAFSDFLAVLNTIDPAVVIRQGLSMLARQSASEAAMLALWREGKLVPRASLGEGPRARALLAGLSEPDGWLPEVERSDGPAHRFPPADAAAPEGDAYVLGFPLRFGEERLGALLLARAAPYPEDLCGFLSHAVLQLSIALSNALAVEQIRRQSRELERANRELFRADRLKSEFVANMSHELRTPMNAILGFSRILLDGMVGPLNEEQKDKVSRIYERGRDLLNLINSILDLSQIEAGRMKLNVQPVDVAEAVRGAVSTIEALVQRKALRLELDIPAGLPPIQADPIKLDQILLNLLGNAVKFTHKGGIRVSVAIGHVNGFYLPEGWIGVTVADSGIGIPHEHQDSIFESFTQVDGSDTREYGGTGLGLAITKKLVELHGGMITLQSTPNQGSTFTVVLPQCPPVPEPAAAAAPRDARHIYSH
ncbi:HAMP domain-containing protein [bacterium]|nr:HAMP domain-containing protein [bacterium]